MEERVRGRVAAVVLAAGRSERMGREKLLLPFRGRALLCAPLEAALGSGADPVLCVVAPGSPLPEAVGPLTGGERLRWVENPRAHTGRASSIRAGLAAVPGDCAAALFLPGDLPGVTAREVDALCARYWETGAEAVVAVEADGAPSHPVLFARTWFPALEALEGDGGARPLLLARWAQVEKVVRGGEPLRDVDTPEAYRTLVETSA